MHLPNHGVPLRKSVYTKREFLLFPYVTGIGSGMHGERINISKYIYRICNNIFCLNNDHPRDFDRIMEKNEKAIPT
jgi:hypothetical protein